MSWVLFLMGIGLVGPVLYDAKDVTTLTQVQQWSVIAGIVCFILGALVNILGKDED